MHCPRCSWPRHIFKCKDTCMYSPAGGRCFLPLVSYHGGAHLWLRCTEHQNDATVTSEEIHAICIGRMFVLGDSGGCADLRMTDGHLAAGAAPQSGPTGRIECPRVLPCQACSDRSHQDVPGLTHQHFDVSAGPHCAACS